LEAKRRLDRLRHLLDRQREALVSGDLTALEALPDGMQDAVARAARLPALHPDIRALRAAAARNAELIEAARRGVSRAIAKVRGTSDMPLTTYTAHGRQVPSGSDASRVLARR
jgi:hypothetical protein